MIILVPDTTEPKREELISRSRVQPQLYVTSGHYLALIAADKVDQWVLFDHPYGVLESDGNPYARLLDLEQGVERLVWRAHLELALSFQFVVSAF